MFCRTILLTLPNLARDKAINKQADSILYALVVLTAFNGGAGWQQVKPDDHSEVVPLLPIPNRTVKRLCANDSAGSRVKVGHRQANIKLTPDLLVGGFLL